MKSVGVPVSDIFPDPNAGFEKSQRPRSFASKPARASSAAGAVSGTRRSYGTKRRGRPASLVPLALVFGAAPGFVAREAHAQETPAAGLTLHWNAPEECPKEADVRSRVDALLGRPAATVASL